MSTPRPESQSRLITIIIFDFVIIIVITAIIISIKIIVIITISTINNSSLINIIVISIITVLRSKIKELLGVGLEAEVPLQAKECLLGCLRIKGPEQLEQGSFKGDPQRALKGICNRALCRGLNI